MTDNSFIFANSETANIITTIISADKTQTVLLKREMTEIIVEDISGRAFRVVTILQLQSLRRKSRESGVLLGGFRCPSWSSRRHIFDPILETETVLGNNKILI